MPSVAPRERRRIVFNQVRSAEWETVPIPSPEALGESEVLLRAACTLVSAGQVERPQDHLGVLIQWTDAATR